MLITGLAFPEGPAFAADGSLWAVELKGESLVQYKDAMLTRYSVGGAPNGLAIDAEGVLWFCDSGQNAIRCFHPATHQTETVLTHVDGQVLDAPNDLAFDRKGNLVFTCPGNSRKEPTGYACVRMKDGTVKKFTNEKYFPNGLSFTPDGKSLVLAETYKHRLWKGDWDAERGEWRAEKIWCETGGPVGRGGPDGMAFKSDGNLYVAVYGTGSIKVVNNFGEVIQAIPLSGRNPTNCAFDAAGNLVVTEAERGEIIAIQ